MSDLHFGKSTATFNPDIFAERLTRVGHHVLQIRSLFRRSHFDELVICLLGDVNDGTGIYPTQCHHQTITNVNQQARLLAPLLAEFVMQMKKGWGKVRVEAVPGNHGRAGRYAHEAANWDIVCYDFLDHLLRREGLQVGQNHPEESLFIRKIRVRQHRYLLYHGHDIRTFANIPWYGMMLRMSRWLSTRLAPFDVALMGHFHTCGFWEINRVKLFLTGTAVTDDDWPLQALGWESAAKWWLFGCSDRHAVTWQYRIDAGSL